VTILQMSILQMTINQKFQWKTHRAPQLGEDVMNEAISASKSSCQKKSVANFTNKILLLLNLVKYTSKKF